MIDIVSIGKQKVSYKDHQNIKFESLSFYISLAQKAISKFGASFGNSSVKEMLKSEDAVSSVANAIMMADWRWDENREGKTGQKKTHYSYRNQCAIWAIKSYISRKKSKRSRIIDHQIYPHSSDKEMSLLDISSKGSEDPVEILSNIEENENIRNYLSTILSPDSKVLTAKQSEYIRMYYFDNMTFAEIGEKFNITREAVRQGIKKALEKIREIGSNV